MTAQSECRIVCRCVLSNCDLPLPVCYFRCNQKRDAIRSMAFSKLPPVLNIQLARYVFDRWVN